MPIHRKFKNVMHNYTPAEVKVREATSNDPWGPTAQIINELSELSFNSAMLGEIMSMIWKRLTDGGRNWRHAYKSLVLLDHMAKVGSEKVAQQCRANIGALEVLSYFEYVNDEGKDEGALVREKSKQLVALLRDEQRFASERAQAIQSRDRLIKNSGLSMGSGPAGAKMSHSKSADRYLFSKFSLSASRSPVLSEELEAVRPSNHGEEDLQLELALAISKQEHDAQLQQKKGDQLKLEMALEESKKSADNREQPNSNGGQSSSTAWSTSKVPDAWNSMPLNVVATATNAWGETAAAAVVKPTGDAWCGANVERVVVDPWGEVGVGKMDPWGEVGVVTDPWSSTLPNVDVMHAPPLVADPHNISDFVDDEFDLLSSRLKPREPTPLIAPVNPGDLIGGLDPDANEKRKKSAEDFLGENSTLVNLSQLLPQPPPQSVMNPFALTIGSKAPTKPNQFFSQQNNNKQPLNQIKQPESRLTNEIAEAMRSTHLNGQQYPLIANQNSSFQTPASNYEQGVKTFYPNVNPLINQNMVWPNSTLQPIPQYPYTAPFPTNPYPTNNNPFL